MDTDRAIKLPGRVNGWPVDNRIQKGTTMNFRDTTARLLQTLVAEKIGYALIGGFAVGLWGVSRGTVDMDFLVLREDLERLDRVMKQLGFTLYYRSENVSQFESASGGIDFLHAFRSHTREMLTRAVEREIFAGASAVRVLRPDDLIGMKVQAMANAPERTGLDLYDIEGLMRLHAAALDWQLIEEYFTLFDMQPLFAILKEKYHAPQR